MRLPKKIVEKDLFQTTTKIQKPTEIGAIASFLILPTLALFAAIYLSSSWFTSTQSDTTFGPATTCLPSTILCKYQSGCEVAPLGKETIAKNGAKVRNVVYGDSASMWICPGNTEALDIAPKASLSLGVVVYCAFENEGYGYFVTHIIGNDKEGYEVFEVDLTSMVINRQKFTAMVVNAEKSKSSVSIYNGFAYLFNKAVILKMDMKTLAVGYLDHPMYIQSVIGGFMVGKEMFFIAQAAPDEATQNGPKKAELFWVHENPEVPSWKYEVDFFPTDTEMDSVNIFSASVDEEKKIVYIAASSAGKNGKNSKNVYKVDFNNFTYVDKKSGGYMTKMVHFDLVKGSDTNINGVTPVDAQFTSACCNGKIFMDDLGVLYADTDTSTTVYNAINLKVSALPADQQITKMQTLKTNNV